MLKKPTCIAAIFLLVTVGAFVRAGAADEAAENSHLYRISLFRISPGDAENFIAAERALRDAGYYAEIGISPPLRLGHLFAGEWDFAFVTPLAADWSMTREASSRKTIAGNPKYSAPAATFEDAVLFREDIFVHGPSLAMINESRAGKSIALLGFIHAAPGALDAVLDNRRRDNLYLETVKRTPNLIFTRVAGGDADVITLSFYDGWKEFTARPVKDPAKLRAAVGTAGFEKVADIGSHLRNVTVKHADGFALIVE